MSFHCSVLQLSEIIEAKCFNFSPQTKQKIVTGITTDSRQIKAGEAFLALVGEKFDGHNFAQAAIKQGAIALITSRPITENIPREIPQLIVEDTLQAYQKIAQWWRQQFKIPVIAITGSVGKTTTKELITAVLSTKGKVLKTEANYNNEIGVPKTLLGITPEHDYAVIEMGMRGLGEIALLTQIACPTIGIITNVGTAHIGRLGSREAIAIAKCELLGNMPPTSIAVLNHDNPLLLTTAAQVWQGKTITYGLTGGDITGEVQTDKITVDGIELPLPLSGNHNALNYLGAIGVAKALGIELTSLAKGIKVNLPPGRASCHQLPNDIIILDETYNAGKESTIAALKLLADTPGKRHIAVLGTMKELGEHSAELHRAVGKTVAELNIDLLFVLIDDPEATAIADSATGVNTQCFTSRIELVHHLKQIITSGDRILCKASNSVGLNKVVEDLTT
ncbi:MAG: UDP-N-acetylmuramoyl-tripeptide--D-alanyl-D-alanine ligase [Cyanobacteria bacterium J083]|nr:MAG: UDP-N-acetylmuramoyl-tripeptide--D-alanyl-D-alanine ligase [Cyanobacteria bacterium J083]